MMESAEDIYHIGNISIYKKKLKAHSSTTLPSIPRLIRYSHAAGNESCSFTPQLPLPLHNYYSPLQRELLCKY